MLERSGLVTDSHIRHATIDLTTYNKSLDEKERPMGPDVPYEHKNKNKVQINITWFIDKREKTKATQKRRREKEKGRERNENRAVPVYVND